MVGDQTEHDDRPGSVAAEQQADRSQIQRDDQDDRHRDGQRDREHRDHEEGPGTLVEPEQGEQVLGQGQDPEAGDRDPGEFSIGAAEQSFGDRPGERHQHDRSDCAGPEERGEGCRDHPFGDFVGLVVEAQQGLDHAEPDHDADRDHGGEHDLGRAVVGRGQESRVERKQRDRDQLRDDAGRGVGGAGAR